MPRFSFRPPAFSAFTHPPRKQPPATGESVLYSFTGGNDGGQPRSGLAAGPNGVFYGSTIEGGANNGVLYSIDLTGKYTVLHTFGDGSTPNDGNKGFATPIFGSDGTLYGVCQRGEWTTSAPSTK